MTRKAFLYKVMKALKGFASIMEIKAEYDNLCEESETPQIEMIENITNWLRYDITDNEPEMIIWSRLEKLGLI